MVGKNITICYFSIYNPDLAPDKVILKGLRSNGAKTIECVDSSWFLIKFWRLLLKHWKIRGEYDAVIVGYLSNLIVPLAKLITKKKVIYNAVNSMYEGVILDRKPHSRLAPAALYFWLIDFLAFYFSDLVLVESQEQKKFIAEKFKIKISKLKVNYIGADDSVFFPDKNIKKTENFTAVFRGGFLPATGVEYVIEAAKILKAENIYFLILGRGLLEDKIKEMAENYKLKNVEIITNYFPDLELREKMLSCHIVLGQFADHLRMDRTIQNKTYEALALGMPYITRDSLSNRELLEDRKNCLFVNPADAKDLAGKILELKDNQDLRKKIAENGYKLYKEKLNPKVLGRELLGIINKKLIK